MKKLQKTARALDSFFKITYRLTLFLNIIGLAIIVFALVLALGNGALLDRMGLSLVQKLDFGGAVFQVADAYLPDAGVGKGYYLASIVLGLLALPLYVLAIRCIRNILAPMKDGLPFTKAVAENLKRLGWLTVAGGIVNMAADFCTNRMVIGAYDLAELFVSDKITAVTTYYHFDFTFIVAAVMLFGLSYVFTYGQELQQLSDETL